MKKCYVFFSILFLILLTSSGCTNTSVTDDVQTDTNKISETAGSEKDVVETLPITKSGPVEDPDAFTLSVPLPFSGSKSEFAEIIKRSMIISLNEFNDAGGFKKGILQGKKMVLSFEDTGGDTEKVKEIATRLIVEDKTPILYGFYGSSKTWEVAQIAAEHNTPYLIQSGSSDKITQQGWDNVFRILPSNSQYPSGLQDFLTSVAKPDTIALIYESSDFGTGLAETMREFSANEGIEVVYDQSYAEDTTDFSQMLTEIKGKNPDIVFMVSYLEDGSLLMKQAKELEVSPKLFVGGGGGFAVQDFGTVTGDAADAVVTIATWTSGVKYSGASKFSSDYESRYGEVPSYHGARGYSSFLVLIDALERTESLGSEDLIEALKKTDRDSPFGPIKFENFDDFTNQNKLSTLVMQWQNGELVTIWPLDAAEKRYWYPSPE